MIIHELSVGVSRTINLGNYESLRIEATATGNVEDGEDLDAARARLISEVRVGLEAAYADQTKKRGQQS